MLTRVMQLDLVGMLRESAAVAQMCRFIHHPQPGVGNMTLVLGPDWKDQLAGKSGEDVIATLDAWRQGRQAFQALPEEESNDPAL